jgi:hypothetical protein
MTRSGLLLISVVLLSSCEEKSDQFFAPRTAQFGQISVTVRVDGEPVIDEVTITGGQGRATTPNPAVFDVPPGEYSVTAANPPGTKCSLLVQQVAVQAGQTHDVIFDCYQLAGSWEIHYEAIEHDCGEDPIHPFDAMTTIIADGNSLRIDSPNAPDTIVGEYDPLTMMFTGTTDLVEREEFPGILAQEAISVIIGLDGAIPTLSGESLLTLDFDGEGSCMVRYGIDGRRVV